MSEIDHPKHYNLHPSGVECVDVAEQFNFNVGNAIKYLWRAGLKGPEDVDVQKALWYLNREKTKPNRWPMGLTDKLTQTMTKVVCAEPQSNIAILLDAIRFCDCYCSGCVVGMLGCVINKINKRGPTTSQDVAT